MSYIALARKYRPQTFTAVVGQTHSIASLTSTLDANKVHHCYLFSGTRGVGKTTLARILAKAINCARGVSSTPCGVCEHCVEIAQGMYVDVVEIDAASRTKVEDTRDMLEQVRYLPAKGARKVYIIDEVHMLSTHSFNALLKTLEEPPEHLCFILATTHPHKLPPTIISRCLQYQLGALDIETISQQLALILKKEAVEYEQKALYTIAMQARGSMRDALSLLDRSLAASTTLTAQTVNQLLGVGDVLDVWQLLSLVVKKDTEEAIKSLRLLRAHAPDTIWLLDTMLTILQDSALYKQVGATDWIQLPEQYTGWIADTPAEQIQLYYQIILQAKRDIAYLPDDGRALEMTALRLIAFSPITTTVEDPPPTIRSADTAIESPTINHHDDPVAANATNATDELVKKKLPQ